MRAEVKEIFTVLKNHRILLSNEKAVQSEIEELFIKKGIAHRREYILDDDNIIDFLLDSGVGIEVKIKGQKRAMYKQCLRYSQFEEIKDIILVTSASTGLPKELNGKETYILNLSKAWL